MFLKEHDRTYSAHDTNDVNEKLWMYGQDKPFPNISNSSKTCNSDPLVQSVLYFLHKPNML